MFRLLCVVFLSMAPACWGAVSFPPGVKICSANDPNINKCFMDTANKLIPHLAKGIKGFGMIPLDPMFVPRLYIPLKNNFVSTLSLDLKNNTHYGMKTAMVVSANINPKDYKLEFSVFLPEFKLIGPYEAIGTVASLPLEGDGDNYYIMYDFSFDMKLEGEPVTRGGETHFNIKNYDFKIDGSDAVFNLTNLLNNKFLSDTANSLLNLSSKVVLKTGLPVIKYLFGGWYRELVQKMFDTVPYNQLFTDLE